MDNNPMNIEVPAEVRDIAEKSLDQARKAIDTFMGAARKGSESMIGSGSTMQSGLQSMTEKSFSVAEKNIGAALDLAKRLVRARDAQEVARIQSEFIRDQMAVMQAQMQEFGAAMTSTFKNPLG